MLLFSQRTVREGTKVPVAKSRTPYPIPLSSSTPYNADIDHSLITSTQGLRAPSSQARQQMLALFRHSQRVVVVAHLGIQRTPFAVKSGGHAVNPGFSSTSGVQISMTRFSNVEHNNATGTVDAGAGVPWDQVYLALDSTGVNVVGGRVPTVGISGLTLGGGWLCFHEQSVGLTIDNMEKYELVLPNGTITNVTESNKDLWFALRGIVTKFTYKTVPQGQVWLTRFDRVVCYNYNADQLDLVKEALLKFQQKNDAKAALTVPVTYTPAGRSRQRYLSHAVLCVCFRRDCESDFVLGGRIGALDPNATVSLACEVFLKDLFSHGSDSAYPPIVLALSSSPRCHYHIQQRFLGRHCKIKKAVDPKKCDGPCRRVQDMKDDEDGVLNTESQSSFSGPRRPCE
ncbi:hypothetical protein EDB84DRAFT_1446349 [Lactarius hengduanensis]|nr:hypothetical protein EDB84DRAFT_1446349 [Lactarius hengduanensis]